MVNGKSEIHALNLNTLAYEASKPVKFATLEMTKSIDKVIDRFKVLVKGQDKAGAFYRKTMAAMFQMCPIAFPKFQMNYTE